MGTPAQVAAQLNGMVSKNKKTAMQRAVLVVEAQAKRESPVKTGTLRRSHTSRVEQGGDRGRVGTNLKYARGVHEGTKPHIIRPRRAKALYWKGARHPVKFVRHPGSRPNKWLERAMRTSRPAVERELAAWGNNVMSSIK